MSTIRLHCLPFIYLVLVIGLYGQTEQKDAKQPRPSIEELHRDVERLTNKYETVRISPTSPDYSLLQRRAHEAKVCGFFEDLFQLTRIREVTPDTTEKFAPVSVSPAGRELLGVGEAAKPLILEYITKGNVTEWQTRVLKDVLRSFELRKKYEMERAAQAAGLPPPPKTPDPPADVIRAEFPGDFPAGIPSKPSPVPKASDEKPVAVSKEPNSMSWVVWPVVVAAGLALLWVLRKR